MTDHRLNLFFNISLRLKKRILLLSFLFCLFHLNAQDENFITLRIEPGILILGDTENLGLLLNVEPNIKIAYNKVIGLRFGVALNSQKFQKSDGSQFHIDEASDNAVMSFVPTFDYYLNEESYRPYLGLGLGFYLLSDIDVSQIGAVNTLEVDVNNQVGFLCRGGFELGRTKFGLEYNFIPKADIEIPNGQIIGTVNSSYFGLSVGFTIGGRKS